MERTKNELLVDKYVDMIRKVAWDYHATTGIEFTELYSEASLAFCEALRKYRGQSGRFSVWLWKCLNSYLCTFISKEMDYRNLKFNFRNWKEPITTDNYFNDFISEMPTDCILISEIVFGLSDDDLNLPPRKVRSKIISSLREQGMSWNRVWNRLDNMKQYVNSH